MSKLFFYVSLISSAIFSISPALAQITAMPASLRFSTASGLQTQFISVTSTSASPVAFSVGANSTNSWLGVSPVSGITPSTLEVYVENPNQPPSATPYTGAVTITPSNGSAAVTISATFTISASGSNPIGTSPSSLAFTVAQGSGGSQTLQLTAFGVGTLASVVTENDWLTVAPMFVAVNPGNTTTVIVTATPNGETPPSPAVYPSTILITAINGAGAPLSPAVGIPVTMTVTGPPPATFTLSPSQLTFTLPNGSSSVPPQNVLLSSVGANVGFTLTTTSNPAGLIAVSPASGTTPATLAVTVNSGVLTTLAPGTYTGGITIISAGGGGTQTLMVSVIVQAPVPPSISTVVNSASNTGSAISPGEVVTIYGMNIGPVTPTGLQLTSNGMVATTLANTSVTFDGIPAPLTYAATGQINAVVPYEIAGHATTKIVVQRNGVSSSAFQESVVNTAPGIFFAGQGGNGEGAILNANGTPNSGSNPAAKGSVIQIFATGAGLVVPAALTGSVTSSGQPFPAPTTTVSVTIGGQPAEIQYAGEAPGLVSGVLQVNAVAPPNTASGPQPVVLTVGSASTAQENVTVAVQ